MIDMISAFGAGIGVAVVCILIGFMMGKTVIPGHNTVSPNVVRPSQGPVSEPEGDYFGDELPDYQNPEKRISTL